MPEWWPAVVFGWPAVLVSMGLAAAGIGLRMPALLVVSAVLVAPLSLYLSGAASWVALFGPVILLSLLASAYAVKRGLSWLAWCSLATFAGVAVWLAVIVASE
jgi:hypothetical protein